MTVHTIINPENRCLGWHSTKAEAWIRARYLAKQQFGKNFSKKELKSIGYRHDEYTENKDEQGSEQIMLQGR